MGLWRHLRSNVGLLALIAIAVVAGVAVGAVAGLSVGLGTYGAGMTAIAALNGWRDRADLRASARVSPWGAQPNQALLVRIVNHGRRPARVESVGVWHERSGAANGLGIYWFTVASYNSSGAAPVEPLPADLGEVGSVELFAYWSSIGAWLQNKPAPRFAYFDDSVGHRTWIALPNNVIVQIATAQGAARAAAASRDAEQSAH